MAVSPQKILTILHRIGSDMFKDIAGSGEICFLRKNSTFGFQGEA